MHLLIYLSSKGVDRRKMIELKSQITHVYFLHRNNEKKGVSWQALILVSDDAYSAQIILLTYASNYRLRNIIFFPYINHGCVVSFTTSMNVFFDR